MEEGEARSERQPEETETTERRQHLLKRVGEVLEEAERGGELEAVYRNQVRNVYIFGSRVHGTHRPDADYDLIALVDGPYYEGPKLIERGDINVNLYHHAYFLLMLKECLIWCLLVLFIPRQFVLKEEVTLAWQLRKLNVRKSALIDSKHNWHKAKRCWREGDIYKAKKNILHGIRYLQFAVQLLKRGSIYDLQSANPLWDEILSDSSGEWSVYETKYKPIYDDLSKELDLLSVPLKLKEEKKQRGRRKGQPDLIREVKDLRTIDYILQFGIEALTRELSISVTVHKSNSRLYHICADKLDSPQDERVVRECAYGMILERDDGSHGGGEKKGEWKVVALPYTKYFSHYRLEALPVIDRLSWSSVKVTEKVDGAMAMLYWYGGKWHVSSWESADGSEELISVVAEDGSRYYYSRKPGYNPWKFFEAKLEWEYANEKFEEDRVKGYFPNQVASILTSLGKEVYNVKQESNTFASLFWSIWNQKKYILPTAEGNVESEQPCSYKITDYVFLFCLCSDRHSLVLAHRDHHHHAGADSAKRFEERIVLHGARNMRSLEEETDVAKFARVFGCEVPQEIYPQGGGRHFASMDEVIAMSLELDPMVMGGFVVVDDQFNRLKVKSPAHRALDKLCWRSDDVERANTLMLDIVRTNEHTSFLTRFPQWRSLYDSVKAEWNRFLHDIDSAYLAITWPPKSSSSAAPEPTNMDSCVQQAKKTGLMSPVLFKMYHRQCSAGQVLRDYPQHLLLRMLRVWKKDHKRKEDSM